MPLETRYYKGVAYRIGADPRVPGIRWFLLEPTDHLGGTRWTSSSGAWYGDEAEELAEAAVRRIIDRCTGELCPSTK